MIHFGVQFGFCSTHKAGTKLVILRSCTLLARYDTPPEYTNLQRIVKTWILFVVRLFKRFRNGRMFFITRKYC